MSIDYSPPGSDFRPAPGPPARRGWFRWVAFDHCRLALPQFTFTGRTDPVSRLHQLALDDGAPVEPAPRPALLGFTRAVFTLTVLRQIAAFFTRYAFYTEIHDGVSPFRQLGDLWHAGFHHNTYPRHYYWRKLHRSRDRTAWLDNLEHRQLTALLRQLNRHLPTARIADKLSFHGHCRLHALPSPTVVAAWTHEGVLRTGSPPPETVDLFLKPSSDFGSTGIFAIRWDPATRTHLFGGTALAWDPLLAALAAHARNDRRGAILQRRLRNAPRNAVYGNDDLCNLRIVTGQLPGGEPEAIGAFLRLPSAFTSGGYTRHVLFATVDLATGRQGTGRLREITLGEFPTHPSTEAPIANRVLPGWPEMLALALRAHRSVPWMPFVGWDIIDTTEGVQVLEANAYWGGDALQAPGAPPLGSTRFPEIFFAWFDHLPTAARPVRRTPVLKAA